MLAANPFPRSYISLKETKWKYGLVRNETTYLHNFGTIV